MIVLFTIFQTKLFPFSRVKRAIGFMQFPYRVAIVMWFITSFLLMTVYVKGRKKKKIVCIILLSIYYLSVTIINGYGFDIAYAIYKGQNYSDGYKYDSMSIGASDYVPICFLIDGTDVQHYREYILERGKKVTCSNDQVRYEYDIGFSNIEVLFNNNTSVCEFEFPLIYYRGYSIKDENQTELAVEKSKNGLVQVRINQDSGFIDVSYTGTPVQHYSLAISGFSFVLLVFIVIIFVWKSRKAVGG